MSMTQTWQSNDARLNTLARHKEDLLLHWNRPSVYWPERTHSITSCGLSKRQEELAQPKPVHTKYKLDRPSAIWPVKPSSLLAVPSPRIEHLAEAKHVNPEWKEDRSVYSIVSDGAKKATATNRVQQLATPKLRVSSAPPFITKSPDEEENESFCPKRLSAPTVRTEALAVPKAEYPGFQHDLPVERKVPAPVLHAQASDRVCQLAKHKIRKSFNEGYDPYKISSAAKNVQASPRLVELSTPPARRQHTKKL
ncbi:Hypothetical predicted protein [Pelobates cultripes]|uniref:Testicular haploid expressed gene protein-like n=1 Tax=Pelobates cultripes TaxID=61616 RepID=A0AAD1S7Y3_PELCU|nr:Hypothetical predicted protein [Pelobates cultripes]